MGVQINGDTGNISATKADYSGNVTIGGTLTYEDVTNIDSVGLITAREGIEVGARPGVAASISVDGNMIVSGISTFGGDVQVSDKIIHSGDTNTAIRFPSADTITAETGGSERTRIDSSGRLLIGLTESATTDSNAHSKLQVVSSAGPNIEFGNNSSDINDDDRLGVINFGSKHGGTYHEVTTIRSAADADHASNSKPSRLELYTTPSGATVGTERLRIDKDGKLLKGITVSRLVGFEHDVQIEGTDAGGSSISLTRNSNDVNPPYLSFSKTRGTSVGSNTIVQTNDNIGSIIWTAADGNDTDNEAAFIRAGIDTGRYYSAAAVGSNDMPGRLQFATTKDGSAGAEIHAEITNDGIFKLMTGDKQSGLDFNANSNLIGGYRVLISDESQTNDILLPKPGCVLAIQPYSNYPTYPQPMFSLVYVDAGTSKLCQEMLDVNNYVSVKNAQTATSSCDNNQYTVMPGTTDQTYRIANRLDAAPYEFFITYL